MTAVPVTALVTRRAVVVLAPVGIVLLVLAAVLDGGSRPVKERLRAVLVSPGGPAAGLALGWCTLSLVWTPFLAEASERLFNLVGIAIVMVAGYLCIRTGCDPPTSTSFRSAWPWRPCAPWCSPSLNCVARRASRTVRIRARDECLALFLWPPWGWLRSRGRHFEALLLALMVAVATLMASQFMPLQPLAAGSWVLAAAATLGPAPGRDRHRDGGAASVGAAPAVLALTPLAKSFLGASDPIVESLRVWRSVVVKPPVRLITGDPFRRPCAGAASGCSRPRRLSRSCSRSGTNSASSGRRRIYAIYRAVNGAGQSHTLLVPAIMASLATAFAFACLGIGTAQIWWFTALAVVVLLFVAAERGQFRTTRPKATLRRVR